LAVVHAKEVHQLWQQYSSDNTLWDKRSYSSTGAYIINKDKMRNIVNTILKKDESTGLIEFKLLAVGRDREICEVKDCCSADGVIQQQNSNNFTAKTSACVRADHIIADYFIYSMGATYALTVPIVTGGKGSSYSTLHQYHVTEYHQPAFKAQREYMQLIRSGKVSVPSFLNNTSCPL